MFLKIKYLKQTRLQNKYCLERKHKGNNLEFNKFPPKCILFDFTLLKKTFLIKSEINHSHENMIKFVLEQNQSWFHMLCMTSWEKICEVCVLDMRMKIAVCKFFMKTIVTQQKLRKCVRNIYWRHIFYTYWNNKRIKRYLYRLITMRQNSIKRKTPSKKWFDSLLKTTL